MSLQSSLPAHLAYLIAGSIALSYVAILYVIPAARSKPWEIDPITRQARDRQHPDIIRARLLAVTLISFLSLLLIGSLIQIYAPHHSSQNLIITTFKLTGFLPTSSISSYLQLQLHSLLLTSLLFLGPIYTSFLIQSSNHPISFDLHLFDLQTLRNLIIGPITEEIVFRACIISTYLLINPNLRPSFSQIIFLSPLWFGAAHIHSIRETYISNGRTREAFLKGLLISLFQFVYTTIFGWYASFIYLRTESVLAVSLCHSFCNLMGFPSLLSSLKEFPHQKKSILISYFLGISLFTLFLKNWISNPQYFPNSNFTWWDEN
ncbi:hypothetical protein DFH28DRAFT_930058 [Melampsora americana]|nr:hypothetical protein DFH28DRAFT_930058 [Melampsora americana]